jgi:hypothetical protein
MVNIDEIIAGLRVERDKLTEAISAVEKLMTADSQPRHSGRKSMGMEERRHVSERMKRYWASRREGLGNEENLKIVPTRLER